MLKLPIGRRVLLRAAGAVACIALAIGPAIGPAGAQSVNQRFSDFVSAAPAVTGTYGATDYIPVVRGGATFSTNGPALFTGLGLGAIAVEATPLALAKGGTHADLSATGGAGQVLKQASAGAAVTVGQLACANLSDSGTGCAAGAASTATAGIAKLHNVPLSVGWPAAINPDNIVVAVINQASTISAIIGRVETATGGAATVSVYKAASGTACGSGTVLHSGSFDANGTAATNQTLSVTSSTLAAGDSICLKTTGTTSWTAGTGVGTITVFLAPTP